MNTILIVINCNFISRMHASLRHPRPGVIPCMSLAENDSFSDTNPVNKVLLPFLRVKQITLKSCCHPIPFRKQHSNNTNNPKKIQRLLNNP